MIVYYRNDFIDSAGVVTDADLPHFRYGAGLFETILYDGHKIHHLDRHLDRLISSTEFFKYKTVSFDYSDILNRLIIENNLKRERARLNICHLFERDNEYSVFASANLYTPPPEDKVFKLCLYPETHDSYMSRHKTMNYMHFLTAKNYAMGGLGCDDALLTDAKGNILETSTAAIVLTDGERYMAPKSPNKLASIAYEIFAEENTVISEDVSISDIHKYDILLMNSLMGGIRKANISPN